MYVMDDTLSHYQNPGDILKTELPGKSEGPSGSRYAYKTRVGDLRQSRFRSAWYGTVVAVGEGSRGTPFVLVRMECTETGIPFRKRRIRRLHPWWLVPVTAIPVRSTSFLA